jgi:sugar lactone lactonase YvrE
VTAATGIVTTYAGSGSGTFGGDGGQATSAGINGPYGITFDSAGNLYIAEYGNHRVRKVTAATGVITTVAGTGTAAYNGDSIMYATTSFFGPLFGVAFDSTGNMYIADTSNYRIRKVTVSTGTVTTVAGGGAVSGDGGQATSAALFNLYGVTVDSAGNVYFVANQAVRKVTVATGIITTYAGKPGGASGAGTDGGQATNSYLNDPIALVMDSANNLYIGDTTNNRIRKVDTTGIITTFAGTGSRSFSGDGGQATSAAISRVNGMAFDSAGNLFFADYDNYRIRKIATGGIISTVAGSGTKGYTGDGGPATNANLSTPYGVTVDSTGNLYIVDQGSYRVRKVATNGTITTFAGTGTNSFSGDGGPATSATFSNPSGINVDSAGNVYVADLGNCCFRKITVSTGIITTVVGIGGGGGTAFDAIVGGATNANVSSPIGVVVDSAGNLYIAETYSNHRIRKVTPGGVITTVAGTGNNTYNGDNIPGGIASISLPRTIALDAAGNLYIADYGNNRIRKVTAATGIITTVAGTGSTTYNGDGIAATSANLNSPWGVALDSAGNIYIAEYINSRVRKVTVATGIITTVAGTGTAGFNGDASFFANRVSFNNPWGIKLDSSGNNLYIADYSNQRVRKLTMATNTIVTVAGTGNNDSSGDGGASTSASVNYPTGVALDGSGNLYITDNYTYRVRKVTAIGGNVTSTNGCTITSVAGTGTTGYTGDNGNALGARFGVIYGMTTDASNNLYIADTNNYRVRKVTASTGIVTTVFGSGSTGYVADPTTDAVSNTLLNNPAGLALDASNNLYIASSGDHRIRRVTNAAAAPNQLNITTIANINGGGGMTDGVPAATSTSNLLNNPFAVAVDSIGYVYVAETGNNRIRAFHP